MPGVPEALALRIWKRARAMSLWWYGHKRGGKRTLWLIDTDPLSGLILIGFAAVVVAMHLTAVPFFALALSGTLLGSGFACLFFSKVSV